MKNKDLIKNSGHKLKETYLIYVILSDLSLGAKLLEYIVERQRAWPRRLIKIAHKNSTFLLFWTLFTLVTYAMLYPDLFCIISDSLD